MSDTEIRINEDNSELEKTLNGLAHSFSIDVNRANAHRDEIKDLKESHKLDLESKDEEISKLFDAYHACQYFLRDLLKGRAIFASYLRKEIKQFLEDNKL